MPRDGMVSISFPSINLHGSHELDYTELDYWGSPCVSRRIGLWEMDGNAETSSIRLRPPSAQQTRFKQEQEQASVCEFYGSLGGICRQVGGEDGG